MLLLLIYLHMYWRLSVLQDIYMKYMGSMVKVCKPESASRFYMSTNKQKPTYTTQSRPSTGVGVA